jgi:hypothetical protein
LCRLQNILKIPEKVFDCLIGRIRIRWGHPFCHIWRQTWFVAHQHFRNVSIR